MEEPLRTRGTSSGAIPIPEGAEGGAPSSSSIGTNEFEFYAGLPSGARNPDNII